LPGSFWLPGFYFGAHPDLAGVFAAHILEDRQNATGKTLFSAIDTDFAFEGLLIIPEDKFFVYVCGDMLPEEDLINTSLTMRVKSGVEFMLRKGIHPNIVAALIAPGVKFCAIFPGSIDPIGEPAVAARKKSYDKRILRVSPQKLDTTPKFLF